MIIFIPVVLAPAIMAPVFRAMLAPDGEFNQLLHAVGLGSLAQPWIGQTSTALPVMMAITIWELTGFTFVLYYAAMTQIEPVGARGGAHRRRGQLQDACEHRLAECRGDDVRPGHPQRDRSAQDL